MLIHQKYNMKRFLLVLGSLTLLLLLAACSTGGSTASSSTPVPTTTPTPRPTPTPSGTAYNGDGYTLTYPQDWKLTTQNGAAGTEVSIVPPNGDQNTAFTITVTQATPAANLDGTFTVYLNALKSQITNSQTDTSVASSATIGGDSWKESGLTGNAQGTQVKGVLIIDQHPASTGKIFAIILGAPASSYDQINTSTFQSILQSFKFSPTNAQKY